MASKPPVCSNTLSPQEQHLVTGGDRGQPRALVDKPFNDAKHAARDRSGEPGRSPRGAAAPGNGSKSRRQARAGNRRAGSTDNPLWRPCHPGSSGAARPRAPSSNWSHSGMASVTVSSATAAVHHDQFAAGKALAQVAQQVGDMSPASFSTGMTKADARSHQASSAPPQLLPCPAVQP